MSASPLSIATQTSSAIQESGVRAELAVIAFKAALRVERAKADMAVEAVKLAAKPDGMGRHVDQRL